MKNIGFTLIELLVTVAVAVILATVAVPSFQRLVATNRVSADHNEILAGLNYARSEATKRRENIVFTITEESPWRYEIFAADDDSNILRVRVSRDARTSVATGSVEFNSLGRRVACSEWNQCAFSVSWEGGQPLSGIAIGLTGRVSRIDSPPENDPD